MKKIITIGLIAVLVAGCAPQPAKPQKTSLEIQAIQARTFDADKKITFNSVMSVLQDLGYIIGSASFETGFITAVSPNKRVDSPAAQLALLFSNSIRTEGKTAVKIGRAHV